MRTRVTFAQSLVLLMSAAVALPTPVQSQTKFAAIGDIGHTPNSAAVAQLIRNRGVDLVLMLGDLCYGSQPLEEQIDTNYKTEKNAGDLRPALGNHEFSDACGGGNAQGYLSYFSLPGNERYYSFKRGPVHFFAINSHKDPDGVGPKSKQALWLRDKLAASTSPWKVVFFHHPPFSSGQHGSTDHMDWPFEAWGADAVLSGHDHDYERIMRDENADGVIIPYFVSGLGGQGRRSFDVTTFGSVKRYSSAFGSLFVTATSTSLAFEFRNTSGTLIDKLIRTKNSNTDPSATLRSNDLPQD
jgi:hypothetical protein